MTVNPQYQQGMQLVFRKKRSGGLYVLSKYAPPAFSTFDMGVTQASISFKNDFKIIQSSAEFETQGRHSIIKHTRGWEGEKGWLEGLTQGSKIIPPKYSQGTVRKLKD